MKRKMNSLSSAQIAQMIVKLAAHDRCVPKKVDLTIQTMPVVEPVERAPQASTDAAGL
jgi:hypothetical protein